MHFRTNGLGLSYWYFGASKGQESMQKRHPMQRSGLYFTIPSCFFSSALVRQAVAHAGCAQCMHCFRTKIGLSGSFEFGNLLRTVKASGVVSRIRSRTFSSDKGSFGGGSLFCRLHASSQLLQPMHAVVSISIP